MKVKTMNEAWELTEKLFPYSFTLDEKQSGKLGYSIYVPADGKEHDGAHILDRGDRLSVCYESGAEDTIWVENERSASPGFFETKTIKIFIFDHYDDYELSITALRAAMEDQIKNGSVFVQGKVIKEDERVLPIYHSNKNFMIYIEFINKPQSYTIKDMRRATQC